MLRLKELRQNTTNFTQAAMARELGMSRQTYGNYEAGRRQMDPETLKKVAQYFGVSVDYLLGGNDPVVKDKKIPKDLKKILEDEEVTLNGRMMSDEDKEKMMRIIEAAFYEAKEMNKRK